MADKQIIEAIGNYGKLATQAELASNEQERQQQLIGLAMAAELSSDASLKGGAAEEDVKQGLDLQMGGDVSAAHLLCLLRLPFTLAGSCLVCSTTSCTLTLVRSSSVAGWQSVIYLLTECVKVCSKIGIGQCARK